MWKRYTEGEWYTMGRTLKAHWLLWAFQLALMLMLLPAHNPAAATNDLKLVIDGHLVMSDPPPVLLQGRTLVPVRLVAESLGAQVEWIEDQGAVHIIKAGHSVLMRIDSHLVQSDTGIIAYGLSDVAPVLIEGRTYVPLRLVGNALGVAVGWDEPTRTVYLDSSQSAVMTPLFSFSIISVSPGAVVTNMVDLKVANNQALPAGAKELRFLLLSPDTGRGFIIARGTDFTATYNWLPDIATNGQKVLVAAIYDAQGRFLVGDAMPLDVAVTPRVTLSGLTPGQVVQGSVALSPVVNFSAAYVTYEVTNLSTGITFVSPKSDPVGTYTWSPMLEDNGAVSFRVTAYSAAGVGYAGEAVSVTVNALRRLELQGLSAGANVEKPVNLSAYGNFKITAIEYILRDPLTGSEESLVWVQTAGHRFFPNPRQAGKKEVLAKVTDTAGISYTTPVVAVNISSKALLLLSGLGPDQVVTGQVNLTTTSNVPIEDVRYILINRQNGAESVIGDNLLSNQFSWIPTQEGEWSIRAEGRSAEGLDLISETVSFRVYLGTVYGPKPIVPRDQFQSLASTLAVMSWKQTGMSAALQTAQAILETGWGQSVPVDKYSGNFSYNLFGIKGAGPAGSVISNTWEEYNGVYYRIDAKFRAYHTLEQSWDDHKNLLLVSQRYQPVRDVMHDSTLGAWALRRAGYATDSQYPIKLIDIINRYSLWELDEVGI